MRVYLPATTLDLSGDRPPRVDACTVIAGGGVTGEELEVLEDEAQGEAALASLRRLRDDAPGGAPRRVVLAADAHPLVVPEPVEEGSPVGLVPVEVSWVDVVAVLVDEDGAGPLVTAVLEAPDQDAADRTLSALWDRPLQWFDASERVVLAGYFTAGQFTAGQFTAGQFTPGA